MNHSVDIGTPSQIRSILEKYHLTAKKSLGQNFLMDPNILAKIVNAAEIDQDSHVIEIGPGLGSLTQYLARAAKKVYAFEIDKNLIEVLNDTLADFDNIQIFHQDILEMDYELFSEKYLAPDEKITVVANLPYYITTPIIMNLLKSPLPIDRLILMMQKEVASRLQASPGEKAYGSLSIAVQYYSEVNILFDVPRTVFSPQPNVDSVVVEFIPREQAPVTVLDQRFFDALIRASFAKRRKTLWNNLRSYYNDPAKESDIEDALKLAEINPNMRGEALSIGDFARLENELTKKQLNLS